MSETDEQIIARVIEKARKVSIDLTPNDFKHTDEGLTIDGMDPDEWLEATTMA